MGKDNTLDDLTGGQHRRTDERKSSLRRWLMLAAFIVLAWGGGTLIGVATPPGQWYADLQKPFFNPPAWVFGPVWTVLYVLVAIAGWRTWMRNYRGLTMQVWFAQLAVNFLWSPAFFGMQRPGYALLVIAVMIVLTILFMRLSVRDDDRASAWLMAPYLAWISFAALLNAAIWWLN